MDWRVSIFQTLNTIEFSSGETTRAKDAYDEVVRDLNKCYTDRFKAQGRALKHSKTYKERKRKWDEILSNLEDARSELSSAEAALTAAETAVGAQKQLIKNLKALLKNLSTSDPDYDDWEQNLHSAENELDDKEDAVKDAKKAVSKVKSKVWYWTNQSRGAAQNTAMAKSDRDRARDDVSELTKRITKLEQRKKQLYIDMVNRHNDYLQMDQEAIEEKNEENSDDNEVILSKT